MDLYPVTAITKPDCSDGRFAGPRIVGEILRFNNHLHAIKCVLSVFDKALFPLLPPD